MSLIVSVHIPKTAGTTLAAIFDRVFQHHVIYDYDGYASPSKPNALIEQNKEFVKSYFKVLHGHFYVRKYLEVFPDARFVTVIRHPVERVISQYLHELNESSSDAWYHDDILSGRMSVVDFAAMPEVGSAMSMHLEGKSIEDFSAVLITEDMRKSLAVMSKCVENLRLEYFFGSPVVIPTLNSSEKRAQKREFSQEEKKAIFLHTAADNDLYASAYARLNNDFKNIQW